MELNYKNAQFAMAIKDVWIARDGGSHYSEGFTCGHIYPIEDQYNGNRSVESSDSRSYLPIGDYDIGTNEFCKNFILVESENTEVEPYTSIRKTRASITEIHIKQRDELAPICERYNKELAPYKKKLKQLEESVGIE